MKRSMRFFLRSKEEDSLPAQTSWPEYEVSAVCDDGRVGYDGALTLACGQFAEQVAAQML